MNSRNRRREFDTILRKALVLPPGRRKAYLDKACQGQPELRAEVDSQLAHHEAPTRIESPPRGRAASRPKSSPGSNDPLDLVGKTIRQYRILEPLGRGGMGVVYKALDSRLNRTVALKFLPRTIADAEQAEKRFFNEARAASALDHNNICSVHEIGETEDGRVFISMAFYDGETLNRKIGRGPLSVEEARDYATQMATGLAAAHARGILHRDIKPSNLMITKPAPGSENGVLKILDFGLAKIDDHQLTRTGTALGTIAYMSPEQARGEAVDHRTDIWALGVVLYEMLTGQRPFVGASDLASIDPILNKDPTPLSKTTPAVTEEFEEVVSLCLQKDRKLRYQTMDELLTDLKALGQAPLSLGRARKSTPWGRLWMGMGVAASVLIVLILALAIPSVRSWFADPPPAHADRKLVAVLPFINNLGTDPENQALVDGLMHSMTGLIASLEAGDDRFWIVPSTEIIQQGVTTAADARKLFGVNLVLTGSVQRLASLTEIVMSVVDPIAQPPRTIQARTVKAPLTPAAREEVLEALAQLLTLRIAPNTQSAQRRADDSTTPVAYQFYLQGVGYLQRYDQAGNIERAIESFSKSIHEDPRYSPAHAGLCEALWDQYRQTNQPELVDRALESCDRAAEFAQGQASAHVAVGRLYYETGQTRKAESELKTALQIQPREAEAYRWLGWVHYRQTRFDEAEQAFRKAIELEPDVWVYPSEFGIILNDQGRYEEAIEQFERSRQLTPENYLAYNSLAVVRRNLQQTDEAKRLFKRSLELQPNPLAARNLGRLHFREQQYQEAVSELERALELHEDSPSFNDWMIWSWLGHAYYWAGQVEEAKSAWTRLVEIATPMHQVNPKDDNVLLLLTDAHVALGNKEQGRYYRDRLLALPLDDVHTKFYIARIYEMLGDRELALNYVEEALQDRFDPVTIDRDPWLKDLRKEPRYLALRQHFMAPKE